MTSKLGDNTHSSKAVLLEELAKKEALIQHNEQTLNEVERITAENERVLAILAEQSHLFQEQHRIFSDRLASTEERFKREITRVNAESGIIAQLYSYIIGYFSGNP